jgi:hypothetical protein
MKGAMEVRIEGVAAAPQCDLGEVLSAPSRAASWQLAGCLTQELNLPLAGL